MEAEGRKSVGSLPKVIRPATVGLSTPFSSLKVTRVLRSRSSQGIVGERPKNRFKAVAVEVVDGRHEHGLVVEHVLAAPFLEQPGQFGRREVALRGTDAHVVASTRRPVDVEPARNLGQEHMPVVSGRVGKQDLAQDRSNRRLAIVRGDVDDPALDRVDARRRNPRHGAGIRDPEEIRRRPRRSRT